MPLYIVHKDELQHHGILGQKWGVRRYQNEDGTLTLAGKQRFAKVNGSSVKQKAETSQAKTVFKQNSEYHYSQANALSRQSKKAEEKASKYAKGTPKNKKLLEKSKELQELSKQHEIIADSASKKLSEINEGTLRAGKDFIVQKDLNVSLTIIGVFKSLQNTLDENNPNKAAVPNPLIGGVVDYTVIEKKKSK